MIKSKKDLLYYLECDKIALYKKDKRRPSLFSDEIWKFEIALRKYEYANNCLKGKIYLLYKMFCRMRYHKYSIKLGMSIPINVFEEGLSIAHYGCIVVNSNARIGKNCRIQDCVTIGATNGSMMAPKIGNNVFLGSGARIIGNVEIYNDVCVGANSVVNKTIKEEGVTIAGVPAKKVSDNNSHLNLNQDILNKFQ